MANEPEAAQIVSWRRVLDDASPLTKKVARTWLYYTLFFWLIPTLITVVILVIARQPVKWLDLLIHGEFLIYAITLTAASTRLIARDSPKLGPFVSRQGFTLTSHIIILPAIVVYGVLKYLVTAAPVNGLNVPFVATYSIGVLAAAFYFSFIVFVVDVQRTAQFNGDIQSRASNAIAQAPQDLEAQFNTLQQNEATAEAVVEAAQAVIDAVDAQPEIIAVDTTAATIEAEFEEEDDITEAEPSSPEGPQEPFEEDEESDR